MLINLRGTYYHYCELPAPTFETFMAAKSLGQFYNQNHQRIWRGWSLRLPHSLSPKLLTLPRFTRNHTLIGCFRRYWPAIVAYFDQHYGQRRR